jgi:hypothetical protein
MAPFPALFPTHNFTDLVTRRSLPVMTPGVLTASLSKRRWISVPFEVLTVVISCVCDAVIVRCKFTDVSEEHTASIFRVKE